MERCGEMILSCVFMNSVHPVIIEAMYDLRDAWFENLFNPAHHKLSANLAGFAGDDLNIFILLRPNQQPSTSTLTLGQKLPVRPLMHRRSLPTSLPSCEMLG